jgi:DNA replication protein DnaD
MTQNRARSCVEVLPEKDDKINDGRKKKMNAEIETKEFSERVKRKKTLTAGQKWQIFLETSARNAPVGEILRRYGLYSSELTKIRKLVEDGAMKELERNRYRKKEAVPYARYLQLETELQAKEKALAQMSEEYLLLKKRTN